MKLIISQSYGWQGKGSGKIELVQRVAGIDGAATSEASPCSRIFDNIKVSRASNIDNAFFNSSLSWKQTAAFFPNIDSDATIFTFYTPF